MLYIYLAFILALDDYGALYTNLILPLKYGHHGHYFSTTLQCSYIFSYKKSNAMDSMSNLSLILGIC